MPPHNYKGKLRTKILLIMAAVGLVPLVVTALLAGYVVQSAHRDDVAKLEAAVITQTGSEVQGFIDTSLLTQTKVIVPFSQSNTVASSAEQYVLTQTLGSLPFIRRESFLDLQGNVTAHADRSQAVVLATTTVSMSNDPGFLAAKGGNDYLGPVSYDANGPYVVFASPVRSNQGTTLGVVLGEASMQNVVDIVGGAKIGNTGYLYLVDQAGNVIGGGGPFANQTQKNVAAEEMVAKVLTGNDLLTGEKQMRYANVAGTPVVAAGASLSEHGQSWGLVAEWPTAEADAVVSALIVRDVSALAVMLLIVILLSIFAALFLTRPIEKLEVGTARVAEGKFDRGVSITTGDELQELGDSFNTMVDKLKELEQLKDEFVFVAAHELRTPIAAMKGYLTLILDGTTGAISDGTKNFIQKVLASNERLIQLVNDLLEVARSQAGRMTIDVAPTALAAPIAGVLDELKALAAEKSVELIYTPPENLPEVLADGNRIKEVVINIVGNAIKYMGGPGKVTITHEVQSGTIVTKIADTGLGISKEAQKKLFEKFYRVQTEKTKDIVGTGLGLFIVKEIIEKMNGSLSVDSEEGKGSTFSFSLPIAPPKAR